MSSFIEKTKSNNSEKCKENLNTEAGPHHQSLQQNDVTNTLTKANSTKPECKRHKSRSKKRKNSKTKKSMTRASSIRSNNFF